MNDADLRVLERLAREDSSAATRFLVALRRATGRGYPMVTPDHVMSCIEKRDTAQWARYTTSCREPGPGVPCGSVVMLQGDGHACTFGHQLPRIAREELPF